MFIFKHFSNSGERSRTISLLKIRQVPKQFPGSNSHSSQVSSAGFAGALTKSLVITQKSHTTISLCHQPSAKTEYGKPQLGFFPPPKKVMETSDETEAFCIGAGQSIAVGENNGPSFWWQECQSSRPASSPKAEGKLLVAPHSSRQREVAFVQHFAQAEPAALPNPANCLIPHLICLRTTENVRQHRVYKIIN